MVENKLRMELKYCERCGGLWLRAAGSALSYCPACAAEVEKLPAARLKLPAGHGAGEGRQP